MPAGAGGLKAPLTLRYSGGTANGMAGSTDTDGGWVGAGWTLDLGSIELQFEKDYDYYFLTLNGVSEKLALEVLGQEVDCLDAQWGAWNCKTSTSTYRTEQESFFKISRIARKLTHPYGCWDGETPKRALVEHDAYWQIRDPGSFQGRDRQCKPPGALVGREEIAFGWLEVMAVQDGVQAVTGLGGQTHHLGPLGHQRPVVAYVIRWHPDGRQQAGGVQAGQGAGGDLVGHDLGAGDERHVRRVNDRDRLDVGQEIVVELKGVGRHLQHHGIVMGEALAYPVVQVGEGHTPGRHHLVLVGVNGNSNEVVLVHVETDKALGTRL